MSSLSAAISSVRVGMAAAYSLTSWLTEARNASSTTSRSLNAEKYWSCWSCTNRRSPASWVFTMVTLMMRTMARLRSSAKPDLLGQGGRRLVVQHREPRHDAAGAAQGRRGDRVHQDHVVDDESGREGGRGDDRAEGVAEEHDAAGEVESGDEGRQPGRVAVDVVRAPQWSRRAEPRQVGRDDVPARKLGDDGLEAVVVAAEAVHQHDGLVARSVAVLPVAGLGSEHLERAFDDGNALELRGVGRGG